MSTYHNWTEAEAFHPDLENQGAANISREVMRLRSITSIPCSVYRAPLGADAAKIDPIQNHNP